MKLTEIANEEYYNNEEPILTDQEFDLLSDDGLDISNFRKKADHYQPMGSLKKIKTEEDFLKWVNGNISVTPKLDGNSIEVVFYNGKLVKAVTRGNGCLDENSIIETENGEKFTISYIVENKIKCRVKTYNHKLNKIEYNDINNWFVNDNNEDWFEIKLENNKILVLTGNHQVWCNNRQQYIKVKDIDLFDDVIFDEE